MRRKIAHFLVLITAGFLTQASIAQSISVQFVDGDGQALESAIAELVLPDTMVQEYQQPKEIAVDQVDGEFVPTVSVISAGNAVSFPNSDDILHHVYSFSPAKTFNIPLYGRGSNSDYREEFVTAGAVEIGCNIHDWMLAYIYVAETELHAVSGADGIAQISNVPSGKFNLRVWHSRISAEQLEILLPVDTSDGAAIEMEVTIKLERDRSLRRAPTAGRRRY